MKNPFRAGVLFSLLFLFWALPKSLATEAIQNDDCLACHENINPVKYAASIHGPNLCTSCHTDIHELPHPDKLAKVNCAACHRIESEIYNSSDHGKAIKAGAPAAKCLDCHGNPHQLLNYRNPKSPVYRLNIPSTCAVCHENQEKMAQYGLLEEKPFQSYSQTVHGKALAKGEISSAVCTDCHGSHDLHAPTNPKSKIFKLNVPTTCGKCHENVLRTYERSVHGKAALSGKREAPVCTDCHGEHTIKSHLEPTSSVYSTVVSEKTCGHCHAAEKIVSKYRLPGDRLKTYLESYHGLASKMGIATVANCASCHGAHDILPSSDPNSSVNKKNLPQTCGKCHPNAGEQLAKGSVHVAPSMMRDRAVYFISQFYIFLIIGVVGGMLLHNFLDFTAKLKEHYQRKKGEAKSLRFSWGERLQHLILFVTFAVLAYTGFALKYPEAWWALPFTVFDVGYDWRGIVHRAMAVIFSALCFYHILFLILTKRGREHLKALSLAGKDFLDFIRMMKHNLGILKERPKFGRYSYIEKTEYWALVWGSMIMIATGTLLTFDNLAMKYLPKWAIDVAVTIHFYEAVLATLAIFIWHLYFTIFDPDHYPMNWSIFTGRDQPRDEEPLDK